MSNTPSYHLLNYQVEHCKQFTSTVRVKITTSLIIVLRVPHSTVEFSVLTQPVTSERKVKWKKVLLRHATSYCLLSAVYKLLNRAARNVCKCIK